MTMMMMIITTIIINNNNNNSNSSSNNNNSNSNNNSKCLYNFSEGVVQLTCRCVQCFGYTHVLKWVELWAGLLHLTC